MGLRSSPWQGCNFAHQLGSFLVSGHESAEAQLSFTSTNCLAQDLLQKQLSEQIILARSSRLLKSGSKSSET